MFLEPQAKLSLDDIENFVDETRSIQLSGSMKKHIVRSAAALKDISIHRRPIYGVNTGFGRLSQVRIDEKDLVRLQINILRSHACGMGAPLTDRVARRLLILRLMSLGKGYSGVSWPLIDRHLIYINRRLTPWIPEQGSVGASGDLAPLAHLGLTFLGEGDFVEGCHQTSASKVYKREKLKPIVVGPKEGLALVNGTQFSSALALEVRRDLKELLPWMEWAAALSIEAHRATDSVFDADLNSLKPHRHQQEVAARFRKILKGSSHMNSHENCDIVQDSYSFRCIPQVLSPCYSLVERAEELLEDEANSVTDNPVLFVKKKVLKSGGHFHAQAVSMACDLMALSMATVGNLTERRVDQLVNPLTTRTKGFLATRPGVESGMMIVQTAMAAILSENKTLAQPASIDTIPTNGNQEDHVSMAPWAARKSLKMLQNLRRLVAGELLCGVRGAVLEQTRSGQKFSPAIESLLSLFAKKMPKLFESGDRAFGNDWKQLENFIQTHKAPQI